MDQMSQMRWIWMSSGRPGCWTAAWHGAFPARAFALFLFHGAHLRFAAPPRARTATHHTFAHCTFTLHCALQHEKKKIPTWPTMSIPVFCLCQRRRATCSVVVHLYLRWWYLIPDTKVFSMMMVIPYIYTWYFNIIIAAFLFCPFLSYLLLWVANVIFYLILSYILMLSYWPKTGLPQACTL